MFSLVLMNTSCTKPTDDVPDIKTLAQQYPDWKNLTWISTDGKSNDYVYPKLSISVVDNTIEVNQWIDIPYAGTDIISQYHHSFTVFNIIGSTFTFKTTVDDWVMTGTFVKNNNQLTLTTEALLTGNHVYVFKIN